MDRIIIALITAVVAAAQLSGCSKTGRQSSGEAPSSLASVPSVRLNYRYEADVPQPDLKEIDGKEDRNAAIQNDFDQNRPQEILDRTLTSPDSKSVAAIYHRADDVSAEFRVDMYSPDGKLRRKVSSDLMAVHFPDSIRWSPNSSSLAFVAMLRAVSSEPETNGPEPPPAMSSAGEDPKIDNSNAEDQSEIPQSDANANATAPSPTPEAPAGIMTYHTEQIYVCDSNGEGTRPLTQSDGFIYFYFAWSPDSRTLAALAVHSREWKELNRRADAAGAMFVPLGRPRIIELNGRERRLDDGLTSVHPVWAPDSSKVAAAFETQVRIYDAVGDNPTQAAILLRNDLLLSSQAFDRSQANSLSANEQVPPATDSNAAPSTLPDPSSLVSFNPIVKLEWNSPELLYFETAYVRRMKNDADSVTSFARWHRLALSAQPGSF